MTDPYCQINKMPREKVASNERLFSNIAYTLTNSVTFRPSGREKLMTGTPKKGPKMVFAKGLLMLRGVSWGGVRPPTPPACADGEQARVGFA